MNFDIQLLKIYFLPLLLFFLAGLEMISFLTSSTTTTAISVMRGSQKLKSLSHEYINVHPPLRNSACIRNDCSFDNEIQTRQQIRMGALLG